MTLTFQLPATHGYRATPEDATALQQLRYERKSEDATAMQQLRYERKVIRAAYEVTRWIKSCRTTVQANKCVLVICNFNSMYGHTTIGKTCSEALLKELRDIQNRVF
jgi:hypothetical protein